MEVEDIGRNQMEQMTDEIFTTPGSTGCRDLKIEDSDLKCFICNCELQKDVSVKVFGTVLPKVGILLCNSVEKFLNTSHVHSVVLENASLCYICFNLFDELESAEEHCSKLRNKLLSNFKETSHLLGRLVENSNSIACQTDLPDEDLPLSIKEEEINVKPRTRSAKKVKTKPRGKRKKSIQQQAVSESSDNEERDSDTVDSKQIKRLQPVAESNTAKPTQTKKKYIRKKHKCEQCPRLFRRPGELKNHLLVSHVGSNPNQCVYCQKKFNSRNGLYVHLKKIHRMQYSDRMELVAILNEEADVDNSTSPKVPSQSIRRQQPETSDAESSGVSEAEGMEEGAEDSSGSEWTEETGTPKRGKPCLTGSRNQTSGDGGKENRGSNSGGGKRILRARYLSEHGIGEDVFVKGEEEEEEEEEAGVKEEEEEGERRKGVKKEEEEGKSETEEKKEERRRRKRRSRVGERACMPLIHACPTCGKKWRTVSELNAHIQTHSDLRPFVCEICGQGYKMRKALLVHVGMHNGIHPFTCHYCNKSFTQKIGLVKHINIHQGTKKYQCDLCGKSFIHYTSYSFHKLVHTGQRLAKCSVCDLALLSKSHLNRHMLVHTGEKPHECDICGKRFAKKWNLNVHRKKLHGVDTASSRLQPIDTDNTIEMSEPDAGTAKNPRLESATGKHENSIGTPHLEGEFVRSNVGNNGKLAGIVSHTTHLDGLSGINAEGEFPGSDVGNSGKLHGVATGRSNHLVGDLSGINAALHGTPPPAPLINIQKCTLCPFTSSRKQALQEHWERDHSRFLSNTYPQEYEEYAM